MLCQRTTQTHTQIVGTVLGVRKCRNADDIIDYSVRRNLLGLQMNNFRGKDSFDYDAI